jgi:hypothetical protein
MQRGRAVRSGDLACGQPVGGNAPVLPKGPLTIVATAAIAAILACGCGSDEPTPAEAQLVAKANRICVAEQQAYGKLLKEFPHAEAGLSIHYSEALLEISTSTAERLEALEPPESIRPTFESYVERQKRTYYEDLTAAHAAHSVERYEYLPAYRRRAERQQEAYELAKQLGLSEECTSSPR